MSQDRQGSGEGSRTGTRSGERDDDRRMADLEADAVRPGDRIVYTSRLDKQYEFTVAEVDATWLTFETGQMVHKDRFDREDFAVVRTATATGQVTVEEADPPDPDESTDEATSTAAEGLDVRSPNAD